LNKIKIYLLILPLFLVNILAAQETFSKKKVDSLLLLTRIFTDEDKVLLYQQISKLYEGTNNDSVFFYANLALEYAQKDKGDSSFSEAYKSLGDAYADKFDYTNALEYYIKSKEYCEKNNNKNSLITIYSSIGSAYRNLKKFSEAIDSYKHALDLAKGIEDYQNESLVLYRISFIYYNINDFNKSLEYAIKSANILLLHNIEKSLADSYNFIGYIHSSLKNKDLAQEYYEKAHALYVKENNIRGLSASYNNLGTIYNENKENSKAIEYYSKSLEYAKQLKDDEGISISLNNIGMIYVEMGQIDKGIDSYFRSLEFSGKLFDKSDYTNTFNNIASAYLKAGNLKKAEEYVLNALPLAKKVTDLAVPQESYQILAKIYSKKGQYNKAFEYQEIQLKYNDSLYTQQKTSSIAEMQTRFETEAKEKEIQLLKKDNEISVLEVERHKNTQKYLGISSVLFLILAIVIFISLRVKRKTNILLSQKNKELEQTNQKLIISEQILKELNATKDKFFSIIAHDLKNPFNALLGFSELLERNYDTYTKDEIKEYINVIYESSQSLFKLLDNLLQWSRTQTGSITYNPEQFELLSIIKQEVSYLQLNADKKKIDIKVLVNKSLSAYADKNIISSVIRNLVNNAIKFTNTNGRVEIRAKDYAEGVEISITDSGIGIDNDDLDKIFQLNSSISNKGTANEEGTGLGLLLCKEFVEMNNGRIWATSIKGKGSTFYFTLPKN
jgi:signal transduction histidine kinase